MRIRTEFAKYRSAIVVVLSISTLLYFSLSVFGSSTSGVFWKFDDAEHLSAATEFIKGKGFNINYIPGGDSISTDYYVKELEIYGKIKNIFGEIRNPLQDKGPIYMMLLGIWLWLFSATPDNWIFWGTILNILLSIGLVCIYYYCVKRSFGFWVAACSSLLLASLSYIFWYAVRIVVEPLLGVFIVLAFYFAKSEMKKRELATLGVLVGLGHLTHAVGIIVGVTIFLFFVIKRKNRNAILFLSTWLITLSPWMIRNTLLFGDPMLGLAIPLLSSFLMAAFNPFIDAPYAKIAGGWQISLNAAPQPRFISPVELVSELFWKIDLIYGMKLVMMLIVGLALTGFTIRAVIPRRNKMNMPELCESTRLQKMTTVSDTYLKTIIYLVVAFSAYYSFSVIGGGFVPEARFILHVIYFLIPSSLASIDDILKRIPQRVIVGIALSFSGRNWRKGVNSRLIILFLAGLLLTSLCVPERLSSVAKVNETMRYTLETPEQRILNHWIRVNALREATIATNEPTGLHLRTGLSTIPFKPELLNNTTYLKWIREKFSVEYIVLYNFEYDIKNIDLGNNTYLVRMFKIGSNEVYKYLKIGQF